jgi:hypothetical protein
MKNPTDNETKTDGCGSLPLATGSAPSSFPYFHSGNEKQDVACLLDMAIDIIEIWDVKNSPYNQELKRCWMKRAQELGANISW